MEFTGNIAGYATSVVSLFPYLSPLLTYFVLSGLTIFALSLILIFLGGYPSLCNASLVPSLQLAVL